MLTLRRCQQVSAQWSRTLPPLPHPAETIAHSFWKELETRCADLTTLTAEHSCGSPAREPGGGPATFPPPPGGPRPGTSSWPPTPPTPRPAMGATRPTGPTCSCGSCGRRWRPGRTPRMGTSSSTALGPGMAGLPTLWCSIDTSGFDTRRVSGAKEGQGVRLPPTCEHTEPVPPLPPVPTVWAGGGGILVCHWKCPSLILCCPGCSHHQNATP